MATLLNIDTATNVASVCLSHNGDTGGFRENAEQREHASFVHTAIDEIVKSLGINISEIDAVAVTAGPGSYTGLRVGMATAKGLCYALKKPLITINTLAVMAQAAVDSLTAAGTLETHMLLCPMIDARRMEVFTALYNTNLNIVLPPVAIIAEPSSFDAWTTNNNVIFFGNGSEKCKLLLQGNNTVFINSTHSAVHLLKLASKAFEEKEFADIAYTEPVYLKQFYMAKV